jgi:hypothetical protein
VNRLLFGDNLQWLRDPKLFPDVSAVELSVVSTAQTSIAPNC